MPSDCPTLKLPPVVPSGARAQSLLGCRCECSHTPSRSLPLPAARAAKESAQDKSGRIPVPNVGSPDSVPHPLAQRSVQTSLCGAWHYVELAQQQPTYSGQSQRKPGVLLERHRMNRKQHLVSAASLQDSRYGYGT